MLDQNTDRMWYVIGAVIIGAAIILIMNTAFPQLFASVGETFQSKTEETTEVVDGIMPVNRPTHNMLRDVTWEKGNLTRLDTVVVKDNLFDWYTPDYISTYGATSMTIALEKSITTVTSEYYGRINAYDRNNVLLGTVADYIYGYEPFSKEATLPKDTAYIRAMLINGKSGSYSLTLHYAN